MSDNGTPPPAPKTEDGGAGGHLNIKVTDGNNEVFFKIKKTTQLKKLMDAFCDRSGKSMDSVRFLFDGSRVQPTDSPDTVRVVISFFLTCCRVLLGHNRFSNSMGVPKLGGIGL